jgi:hypothetical protein
MGDDNLSCAELNQEIGRIRERMDRLVEANEQEGREKAEQTGYANAYGGALFGPLLQDISNKVEQQAEEPYGSESGHFIQAYQERLQRLETLSRNKGC